MPSLTVRCWRAATKIGARHGPQSDMMTEVKDLSVHGPIYARKLFKTQVQMLRSVDGVRLDVKRGESVGLVGVSGSGKTTVGRAIQRAIDPTDVEVIFHRKKKGDVDLAHAYESELRNVRSKMNMAFSEGGDGIKVLTLVGDLLRAFLPELRLVFQDPYYSLNPRMNVYEIITEPFVAAGKIKENRSIPACARSRRAAC